MSIKPEKFFYGSIDVINNNSIMNYLYHLFEKQEENDITISFDHDDYPINIKNIIDDTDIIFSYYSIYKNKNQIIKYYKIIDKMETINYLKNTFYFNTNYKYDSSIYNCVYYMVDKDNMNTNTKNVVFYISKIMYVYKYLFGYDKKEFDKSDVMTIINYIFRNKDVK